MADPKEKGKGHGEKGILFLDEKETGQKRNTTDHLVKEKALRKGDEFLNFKKAIIEEEDEAVNKDLIIGICPPTMLLGPIEE